MKIFLKDIYQPLKNQDKVIIGLGDSFTQGVGGWSRDTYSKYKGKIDYNIITPDEFKEMYNNSWVNQLQKKYFLDHVSINLGKLGTGNRSAAGELYLNPEIKIENASRGYLIFMLSGLERFDFINNDFNNSNHFFSIWPQKPHKGVKTPKSWISYRDEIWSEKFSIVETIISIKNVESFANFHNLKLILISAFDQRYRQEYFKEILGPENNSLVNSIPWDRFCYPRNMNSCINVLVDLEGKPQDLAYGDFWPFYNNLTEPSEYISNCAHPTIKGYEVMADEIYKFIKEDRS